MGNKRRTSGLASGSSCFTILGTGLRHGRTTMAFYKMYLVEFDAKFLIARR